MVFQPILMGLGLNRRWLPAPGTGVTNGGQNAISAPHCDKFHCAVTLLDPLLEPSDKTRLQVGNLFEIIKSALCIFLQIEPFLSH